MEPHYRDTRKIDPAKGVKLGDGTPNDNDRVEIGPRLCCANRLTAGPPLLPDRLILRAS